MKIDSGTTTAAARRASPLVIMGLCLLLVGCEDEAQTREKERLTQLDDWVRNTGTLAQICRDGTRIMFVDGKRWAPVSRGIIWFEWKPVPESFTC